jgi:DNA-directed RNA polymerase subunit F
MANNPIQTILNDEQKAIFNQYKEDNNIKSNYEALRNIVSLIPTFNQEVKEVIVKEVEEELKQDELSKLLNELKD